MSIWAALLAVTGSFDQLTNMAVMSYALFWIPVVLAVIVLRRRLPDAPRPVPRAGRRAGTSAVRTRHGMDRRERPHRHALRVDRHHRADPPRPAAVPAVPRQQRADSSEAYKLNKDACLKKVIANAVAKVDQPNLSAVFATRSSFP
jgi:hypothetical protein